MDCLAKKLKELSSEVAASTKDESRSQCLDAFAGQIHQALSICGFEHVFQSGAAIGRQVKVLRLKAKLADPE